MLVAKQPGGLASMAFIDLKRTQVQEIIARAEALIAAFPSSKDGVEIPLAPEARAKMNSYF